MNKNAKKIRATREEYVALAEEVRFIETDNLKQAILQYITGLEDAEIVADDIVRVVERRIQEREQAIWQRVNRAVGEDEPLPLSAPDQFIRVENRLRRSIRSDLPELAQLRKERGG